MRTACRLRREASANVRILENHDASPFIGDHEEIGFLVRILAKLLIALCKCSDFRGHPVQATAEVARLAAETLDLPSPVVFVSNEVGHGIAPATALGRTFRDEQGRANQEIAAACGAVVFVTAGLPALIKPAPLPDLRLT